MLNVTLAPPQRHDRLTIFPLLAKGAPELPFVLMADALMLGTLRITEVGSGVVGELAAVNSGGSAILVLDGEQLIGAKQNRTTNFSLIPAKSELRIPVSCMEQGRWHDQSRPFTPSQSCSPISVRRRARDVEHAASAAGEPASQEVLTSAQGGVWETIHHNFADLRHQSSTVALDELYTSQEDDLGRASRSFTMEADQVGILAFVGDAPIGMDLIGCRLLYEKLHERLLRGYLMDALASRRRPSRVSSARAQKYLDRVRAADRVAAPTIGAGRYAVLNGTVVGVELEFGNDGVHLSAFPVGEPGGGGGLYTAQMSPPSRRRR
jgi:hypothetical protein